MEELIYVYFGLATAAFILCLLALIVSRRQARRAEQAVKPEQPKPKAKPQAVKPPRTKQAPSKRRPAIVQKPAAPPSRENLDRLIQSGFAAMEQGDFGQALAAFQSGLQMTSDPRVSVQLHLELAKLHNVSNDKQTALRHLDQALEIARNQKNGATEQELLSIRQTIAQPSP